MDQELIDRNFIIRIYLPKDDLWSSQCWACHDQPWCLKREQPENRLYRHGLTDTHTDKQTDSEEYPINQSRSDWWRPECNYSHTRTRGRRLSSIESEVVCSTLIDSVWVCLCKCGRVLNQKVKTQVPSFAAVSAAAADVVAVGGGGCFAVDRTT